MALKNTMNTQDAFTGQVPSSWGKGGLWRFNESEPDANTCTADSSGNGRDAYINKWSGTTADFKTGHLGNYFQMNINNPSSEQTYLRVTNDGTMFSDIGERIVVGGWMKPTTYSVGNTYTPLLSTRAGTGNPIFYLSLIRGKPRLMLYNSSGSLILDTSVTPSFSLTNGNWYFIAAVIEPDNQKAWYVVGDRASGTVWTSSALTISGTLNRSCTADLVWGMLNTSYWYAGGFDDWFLDCDSDLTTDDIAEWFLKSLSANGADTDSDVDGLAAEDTVMLKGAGGVYAESGVLVTAATECGITGTGRVSVKAETSPGVTSVSLVETSTSDDLATWTDWISLGTGGALQSPSKKYIRYRITLSTTNTARTPVLTAVSLYDNPKPLYSQLGYARPVILGDDDSAEAVLENAYDIIVTSEINGIDTLEFKLPFKDSKREYVENEKQVRIVSDTYRIRTVTDDKDESGKAITSVYAEAAFYDLSFSAKKEENTFTADTADVPMAYALQGTEWEVGVVNVSTKRTWTSTEDNALSILRHVQNIHGGDLIFDNANKLVNLLTFSGTDSGALFCYRKNMKSIQRVIDTTSLITRLYAVGADGMTFANINDGKPYVEDFTYTDEIRIKTLDCSNFTNPYQMLEFANMRLADYAAPRISYVLKAMDLTVLTGYEHEAWNLGDTVMVVDEDLDLSIKTRIVRREYNLQEPWNTVLELSTTLRELGDSTSQWDAAADVLEGANYIDNQQLQNFVPFNHLKNSRADSNFSYWTNSGFEVDGDNGVTGTASFKCEGAYNTTKYMEQTVTPSNRDSYTFSAQIATENLSLGSSGQVGVEIVIEYEDGSTETRMIDLISSSDTEV
jgi:phage minor structural protein|uniref:Tail protein n=1 Tax=Siphoviridae sp. ctSA812 TaxID=2825508 RepID=A0A8S5U3D4_9CAUD|nr:MAG TPA: tail protein [Siphoviridae sp. ctSA812]